MIDLLSGEGLLTFFLLIDIAFGELEPMTHQVLSYHVVKRGIYAGAVVQAIADGQNSIVTLGGAVSFEQGEDGEIYIGGAMVITTDIFASNGVIHLIDSIITPPTP